jgi:leader peptidase (prepilin peptidase)/N-methyltransferase
VEPATAAFVWTAVASALLGLSVGSFLNVAVHRLPRGMSVVHPPSHCPSCGTELRAVDNVPLVSWLVLRGRCRTCSAPISPRYPLVELGTALAFLGLALATGASWALPPLLVVTAAALAAAVIDADATAVPWALPAAAGVGDAALVVVAVAGGHPGRLGWAALGAVATGAVSLVAWRAPGGARRAAVAVGLGWAAGWLWPPGGPLLAAWVVAAVAAGALRGRGRRPGRGVPLALALVAAGGYGLLLAGAVAGL